MPDLALEVKVVSTASVDLDMTKRLDRAGRLMASRIVARMQKGSFAENAPLTVALKGSSKPLHDTGALLSSIHSRVEGDSAIVGTNRAYARFQQEGGTIRAKNPAGNLYIPASREVRMELRAVGGRPKTLIARYKARGWNCWRSGHAFFAGRDGGRPRMLFILKSSVTIPARPFMYMDADDRRMIREVFGGLVEVAPGRGVQPD